MEKRKIKPSLQREIDYIKDIRKEYNSKTEELRRLKKEFYKLIEKIY